MRDPVWRGEAVNILPSIELLSSESPETNNIAGVYKVPYPPLFIKKNLSTYSFIRNVIFFVLVDKNIL